MIHEKKVSVLPGLPILLLLIAATGISLWWLIRTGTAEQPLEIVLASILVTIVAIAYGGLFIVKKKVSLRVRNFETNKLKVNDSRSNPST